MTKLPVVAAITNYNMAKELEHLLPQVVRQGYDEVFVLDDASTDNSREVVANFEEVKFVAGESNKGAGANRNRIIGALGYDALIHFLDADVDLETENTAEIVRSVAPDEPFGFVGGLIKTSAGELHPWNYGAESSLGAFIASQIQILTFSKHSKLAHGSRRLFKNLLSGWPQPSSQLKRREIYWCAEGNMIVRSDIFAELGGFDESFRETEILELADRIRKRGLKCYFDPRLSVRHTEGKVREYNRNIIKAKEMLRHGRQLGFKKWLSPRLARKGD